MAFCVDDAISVDVQWDSQGARCLELSQLLAFIHDQAMGKKSEGKEPLLLRNMVADWATQQEVWGYIIDTERMTVALPTRKVDDLCARIAEWPGDRQSATVRGV